MLSPGRDRFSNDKLEAKIHRVATASAIALLALALSSIGAQAGLQPAARPDSAHAAESQSAIQLAQNADPSYTSVNQGQAIGPGQWICRGEPPPPGKVITATGEAPDCEGLCNGTLVEPLRSQMVICGGQPVPDGYEVVENTTSPRCGCIASNENALVIRLLPGMALPGVTP